MLPPSSPSSSPSSFSPFSTSYSSSASSPSPSSSSSSYIFLYDAAASNFCRLEAFDDLYNRLSTSIKRSKADEFINRRSKFLTLRPVSKLRREKAALYVSLSVRSVGSYPRNPLSVSPSVCLSCPSVYPSIGQCLRYHYIGIKM